MKVENNKMSVWEEGKAKEEEEQEGDERGEKVDKEVK